MNREMNSQVYILRAFYAPPKVIYTNNDFVQRLINALHTSFMEEILTFYRGKAIAVHKE